MITNLQQLYALRFADTGLDKRKRVWKILCEDFFNKLINPENTVLDLACGYGEFINNVRCRRKIAVDVNPDAQTYLNDEVMFVECPATNLTKLADDSVDTVFTSNFLEHLQDRSECDRVFAGIRRILKLNGEFIVIGPNIKYAYKEYWDYYDHILPFSDLSISEGLRKHGFSIDRTISRFLPYTMNGSLPTPDLMIKLYLRLPLAWRILGKQFLVVASKVGG